MRSNPGLDLVGPCLHGYATRTVIATDWLLSRIIYSLTFMGDDVKKMMVQPFSWDFEFSLLLKEWRKEENPRSRD